MHFKNKLYSVTFEHGTYNCRLEAAESLIITLNRPTLEVKMFLSLLELCQTFPTSSHTNLALWILRRLKNALPLSSREEANLYNRQVLLIKLEN